MRLIISEVAEFKISALSYPACRKRTKSLKEQDVPAGSLHGVVSWAFHRPFGLALLELRCVNCNSWDTSPPDTTCEATMT